MIELVPRCLERLDPTKDRTRITLMNLGISPEAIGNSNGRRVVVIRVGESADAARLSVAGQLTLARFIETGAYDRHLCALRSRYRTRRDRLVAAIAQQLPDYRLSSAVAGLHVILSLPPGLVGTTVTAAARARGVRLMDLRTCRVIGRHPTMVRPLAPVPTARMRGSCSATATSTTTRSEKPSLSSLAPSGASTPDARIVGSVR